MTELSANSKIQSAMALLRVMAENKRHQERADKLYRALSNKGITREKASALSFVIEAYSKAAVELYRLVSDPAFISTLRVFAAMSWAAENIRSFEA